MKEVIRNLLVTISDPFLKLVFCLTGMKPWSVGYGSYKRDQTVKYLDRQLFDTSNWPEKYGYRLDERIIEYPWLFSRLSAGQEKVLDAGSILNYSYIIQRDEFKNKKIYIVTLAPEPRNFVSSGIAYLFEDVRHLPFSDEYFDSVISLSTIEHIGMDNSVFTGDSSTSEDSPQDFRLAMAELSRLLTKGGKLFLSVPFGKWRHCGWYQVFDKSMVMQAIGAFAPTSYQIWCFRYYSDGWRPVDIDVCADDGTYDPSQGDAFTEDYLAFSRAVCCVELVK